MSENSSNKQTPVHVKILRGLAATIIFSAWTAGAFYAVQYAIAGAFLTALDFLGIFQYDQLTTEVKVVVGTALIFSLTLLIVLFVPWLVIKHKTTLKELGLERLASWWDLLLGPVAFVPYIILSILLSSIAAMLPWYDAAQVQDIGLQAITGGFGMTTAFFALVIIAPVAEEILFRGYLYGKVKKYVGVVFSTLVVSVCFGALHGQWNVAVDVFALSVIMCALRELTGSIWAGIVLHMAKNAIAFTALFVTVF